MKTILVTGASGQLGMCLRDISLENKDYHWIFKDSKQLDITVQNDVYNTLALNKVNIIVNCAAYTAVDIAEDEKVKAEKINGTAVLQMAEICEDLGITLIHISTDFVFNGSKTSPYLETDKTEPINHYGFSKLLGESYIRKTMQSYFIIRTSWVYSEYGSNFVKTMLHLSNDRDELSVISDQVGIPTYARSLAVFIVHIISSDCNKYGIINYTSSDETSWFSFAREIFNLSDIKIKINPIDSSQWVSKAKRPLYSVLDTNKAKSIGGIIEPWKHDLRLCLNRLN